MLQLQLDIDFMQILLGCFILLIIAYSLLTTVRVVPYSRDNMFAIEFPYEGFNIFHPTDCECSCKKETFSECSKEKGECDNKNENKDCKKVHGFDDLYCSPRHTPIYNDKFLGTDGGTSENSYGLMNSKGGLQLTQEQIELLTTRGGNYIGTESKIDK